MKNYIVNFDITKVTFEEKYESKECSTTTLYFIAPKEWLENLYSEAAHSKLSVEFPTDKPETCYTSVVISPTRQTKNGFEDYDWCDIDMAYDHIEALINLSERSE